MDGTSAPPTPGRLPAQTTAPEATPKARPVSVWRTVIACEIKLLRSDSAWWLALVLLLACVAYALFTGHARLAEQAATVKAAQQDEVRRLDGLKAQLAAIESGQAALPSEPFRDPGNALAVGRGSGATIAPMAPAPLAALAVGLSDLYPPSFKVSAGSQDRFLFTDEITNPTHLASGSFDIAFVVVYLLPLLLLALAYNVLSGEREQGTLALVLASSAPLSRVLVAKLAVRGGGVLVVLLLTLGLGLCAQAQGTRDTLLAAAALVGVLVAYTALWLAIALWVNSWQRDSAFNAVALVMAWVLLLLVVPAGINAVAQVLHPAPARAELVLAVRQAAVDADRDREAEQARFRQEHGLDKPAPGRDQRALTLLLAADRRADDMLARHEAMVQAQRRFSDRMAWLSPPLLVNDALAELAGNGHSRWDAQLQRVSAFHERWQAFFVAVAQRGARLTRADYAALPRFETAALPVWTTGTTLRVLPALGWLALLTTLLLVHARRRLSRAG